MRTANRTFINRLAAIMTALVLAVTLLGLLMPEPWIGTAVGGRAISRSLQNTAHVLLFATLAASAAAAQREVKPVRILVLVLLLGAGTEWLQQFVGRGSNLEGVLFDLLGAAVGLVVAAGVRRLLLRRASSS